MDDVEDLQRAAAPIRRARVTGRGRAKVRDRRGRALLVPFGEYATCAGLRHAARRRHRGRDRAPRRRGRDRDLTPAPLDGGVGAPVRLSRAPARGRPALGRARGPGAPLLERRDARPRPRPHADPRRRALRGGTMLHRAAGRAPSFPATSCRSSPSAGMSASLQLPEPDPAAGGPCPGDGRDARAVLVRGDLRRRWSWTVPREGKEGRAPARSARPSGARPPCPRAARSRPTRRRRSPRTRTARASRPSPGRGPPGSGIRFG